MYYFLYSDEQIAERNEALARVGKKFVPGLVSVGGRKARYSQLTTEADLSRYSDTRIIAKGEVLNKFTYTNTSIDLLR